MAFKHCLTLTNSRMCNIALFKFFAFCSNFCQNKKRILSSKSFVLICRYLKNPKDLKCHLASLIAACFAVLSKETGIMALAINICYGTCCHLMSHRTRPGRKPSSNRKIAFKRISTDAFMVRRLTTFLNA